jgi:hypothetical protein
MMSATFMAGSLDRGAPGPLIFVKSAPMLVPVP